MSLVTLVDVRKRFGAEQVLDAVSFRIERGDHAALVGANGAGKSTLLRIIAGLEQPDSGSVAAARGARVAYLPQDPDFEGSATLYDAMLAVFQDAIDAQNRLRTLEHRMAVEHSPELVHEYGQLQSRVEHAGYDYRNQIERVLLGLELVPATWHAAIEDLSGGQRTRANLARTLLQDADVLLLDEPTNHLDIRAVEWLENYLRGLGRAFLIVAHDRYLLDRVTKRTIELSFGRTLEFDAPYSQYLKLKAERLERQRLEYEAQQRHITKTEDFIRRYGAGQRAREARGRQKQLDRLQRVDRPRDEGSIHLQLTKPGRSGEIVLELHRLIAGYPDKPLVSLPEQVVFRRGERVAVIGPNGSGKTTLLRTLMGILTPLSGTVRWGAKTSIGYYSQTLGHLDEHRSVLEEMQQTRPLSEEEARGYLGRFLFSGDDVFKTIAVLSGGERSRVALAKLILEQPNVLVLDEPTNHLDIASRDALQQVLSEFPGTLLFVSHDRYLIDTLTEEIWVIQDGRLQRYAGTYSELAEGRARRLDRDEARHGGGRRPDGHSPEQRLRELETEAESLADRLSAAGPTTSVAQLSDLMDRYAELQSQLQEANDAWLRSVRAQLHASSG
jgi:ATP-binding cassette, subfamily F, member 3